MEDNVCELCEGRGYASTYLRSIQLKFTNDFHYETVYQPVITGEKSKKYTCDHLPSC